MTDTKTPDLPPQLPEPHLGGPDLAAQSHAAREMLRDRPEAPVSGSVDTMKAVTDAITPEHVGNLRETQGLPANNVVSMGRTLNEGSLQPRYAETKNALIPSKQRWIGRLLHGRFHPENYRKPEAK